MEVSNLGGYMDIKTFGYIVRTFLLLALFEGKECLPHIFKRKGGVRWPLVASEGLRVLFKRLIFRKI